MPRGIKIKRTLNPFLSPYESGKSLPKSKERIELLAKVYEVNVNKIINLIKISKGARIKNELSENETKGPVTKKK